ncbi:MAG: thermonuclease family protein [Candidatus Magasanikbacteria bacterium]
MPKINILTKTILGALIILSGLFAFVSKTTQDVEPTQNVKIDETAYYQVTKIVDGDTIDVNIDGKTERIRLIGIDTPETVDYNKPIECFGPEATAKAKELLLNQKVRLEADPTQDNRDAYDRLLRYIYRDDGLFFNQWMIENGYAREFTFIKPYKYQTEFKQAEINAQNGEVGLWKSGVCD